MPDAKLIRGFLEKNYKDYNKEPLKVGFTQPFPENLNKVVDTVRFEQEGVKIEARLTKLMFGSNNQHEVTGIVVDCLNSNERKFGDCTYEVEAEAMKMAAIGLALKHNLMICTNICTWPFVKIVVSEVYDKHLNVFSNTKQIDF